MLTLSAFLFLSGAAIAMYFAASVQYLELVFDHYYRFVGLGIGVAGLSFGLAVAAVDKGKGFFARVVESPARNVFLAVAAQIVAGYAALNLVYGAGWTFLLLVLALLIPYMFWICACSTTLASRQSPRIEKFFLIMGVVIGLIASPWFLAYINSLSALWLFASALLAFSILPLAGRKRLMESVFSVWVAAGLVWLAMSAPVDSYPRWNESRGTVIKPIAVALSDQKELGIQSTEWLPGIRLDRMTSERSRKDGFGWQVVNGTAPVPFVDDADGQTYAWWKRRFPLLAVPVETDEPRRMLSIGALRGPDANIAALAGVGEHNYLEYADQNCRVPPTPLCVFGLGDTLSIAGKYDLIHLSVPHPVASPWIGANIQDEYLLTSEMLARYLSMLDQGGVLAITARDEVIFMKLLISVWHTLLPGSDADVMGAESQLRLFRLNQFAPYKGSYRFLLMVSPEGFSAKQLKKMNEMESALPIERLIYQGQVHSPPYNYFDNPMTSHSLKSVQEHLTRYAAWRLQSRIRLLEPSSLDRPDFFYLSAEMHPFLRWLLTGVLVFLVIGVLFAFRDRRGFKDREQSLKPAIAVLLMQVIASAAASVFLLTSIIQPVVFILQAPQQRFLWLVALMVLVIVGATRWRGEFAQDGTQKATMVMTGLLLLTLFIMYLLQGHILSLVQSDRPAALWWMAPLLLLITGWFAWRVHQQVIVQLRQLYSLPLSWSWALTGLGGLGAIVVATQVWLQAGWSSVIIYAAVLYGTVFIIASWTSGSTAAISQTKSVERMG